jgi:ribosome biogenesis protein ENP2
MALPVTSLNGVKVYNLSTGHTLPQWLEDSHKKKFSLRYNQEFRTRIELIQDFTFPAASYRLKASPDGRFLIASGTYPPQIKVFELEQLSQKCERHLDGEVTQIEVLSEDFSKLALLRVDRTLEFHAKFGAYHRTRLPKICRDMAYHPPSCDLFIGGCTPIVYRVNLHVGSHLSPLESSLPSVNAVKCNPVHHLLALGGEGAAVEFWDPRDRARAAHLHVPTTLSQSNHTLGRTLMNSEVTALEYDTDGLTIGVGTSTGHVLLYDLRSQVTLLVKDHKYQLPIRDIKFHARSRKLITADTKIVKLWDRDTGDAFSSIQAEADINSLCMFPNTGLIMAAVEQHRIQAFYVPALGPAPKWCSFLDNMTEELEESKMGTTIYEDYKFVTRDELGQLNLTDLIGSNLLRPYMHGFFIDIRLYNKVKAASDPYAYDTYVKDKVKKKIEEKRANRIVVQKRLPKVNAEYAKVLLEEKRTQAALRNASSGDGGQDDEERIVKNPLRDDRFAKLFADDSFRIDTSSSDYLRLHPSNFNEQSAAFDQRFSRVDDGDNDDDDDDDEDGDRDADDDDDDEDSDGGGRRSRARRDDGGGDDSDDDNRQSTKGRMHKLAAIERAAAEKEARKQQDMWARAEQKQIEREAARQAELGPAKDGKLKRKQPAMFELKKGFGLPSATDRATGRPASASSARQSFEEMVASAAASEAAASAANGGADSGSFSTYGGGGYSYSSASGGGRGRGRGGRDSLPTHASEALRRGERRGMSDVDGPSARGGGAGGFRGRGRGGSSGGGRGRGGGGRGRGGGGRGGGRGRGRGH